MRILLEISSLTCIVTSPPFLFLSKRYGLENPSTWNCETGKVSSSLVSVTITISNIPFTRTFRSSNLLGKELRLPMMTLFICSILVFLILEKEFRFDRDFTDCHFHYYWVPKLCGSFWNYNNVECFVSPNLWYYFP